MLLNMHVSSAAKTVFQPQYVSGSAQTQRPILPSNQEVIALSFPSEMMQLQPAEVTAGTLAGSSLHSLPTINLINLDFQSPGSMHTSTTTSTAAVSLTSFTELLRSVQTGTIVAGSVVDASSMSASAAGSSSGFNPLPQITMHPHPTDPSVVSGCVQGRPSSSAAVQLQLVNQGNNGYMSLATNDDESTRHHHHNDVNGNRHYNDVAETARILPRVGHGQAVLAVREIPADDDTAASATTDVGEITIDSQAPTKGVCLDCAVCEKSFETFFELIRHSKKCAHFKQFSCDDCEATFNQEINYRLHSAVHEAAYRVTAAASSGDDGSTSHQPTCPECDKAFGRLASFKCHITLHEVDDAAVCEACEEEFVYYTELRHHRKVVHDKGTNHSAIYCKKCGAILPSEEKLKEHTVMHRRVRESLKLKHTGRDRKSKRDAVGSGGFAWKTCHVCRKSFTRQSALDRHLRVHTGERPYVCEVCGKGFAQPGGLKTHSSVHAREAPFKCTLCGAGFNQKGNLRKHVKLVHPDDPDANRDMHPCHICSCVFKSVKFLNGHITRVHGLEKMGTATVSAGQPETQPVEEVVAQVDNNAAKKPVAEKSKGQEVTKVFIFNPTAEAHELLKRYHPHTVVTVIDVTKSLRIKRPNAVQTDSMLHSELRNVIIERTGRVTVYFCPQCGEKRDKPSDLVRHVRKHTGHRPYLCPVCDQRFITRSNMRQHMDTHMVQKVPGTFPECYICRKTFTRSSTLQAHLRGHQKAPSTEQNRCRICGRTYRMPHNLARHFKKVHENNAKLPHVQELIYRTENRESTSLEPRNNEPDDANSSTARREGHPPRFDPKRSFACTFCPWRFHRSDHLRTHIRCVHLLEKPFSCQTCNRKFTSFSNLKQHCRSHVGLRNFHCNMCSASFITKAQLRRHSTVHNSAKPFQCPYCEKKFSRGVLCRRHLKRHKAKDITRSYRVKAIALQKPDAAQYHPPATSMAVHQNVALPGLDPQTHEETPPPPGSGDMPMRQVMNPTFFPNQHPIHPQTGFFQQGLHQTPQPMIPTAEHVPSISSATRYQSYYYPQNPDFYAGDLNFGQQNYGPPSVGMFGVSSYENPEMVHNMGAGILHAGSASYGYPTAGSQGFSMPSHMMGNHPQVAQLHPTIQYTTIGSLSNSILMDPKGSSMPHDPSVPDDDDFGFDASPAGSLDLPEHLSSAIADLLSPDSLSQLLPTLNDATIVLPTDHGQPIRPPSCPSAFSYIDPSAMGGMGSYAEPVTVPSIASTPAGHLRTPSFGPTPNPPHYSPQQPMYSPQPMSNMTVYSTLPSQQITDLTGTPMLNNTHGGVNEVSAPLVETPVPLATPNNTMQRMGAPELQVHSIVYPGEATPERITLETPNPIQELVCNDCGMVFSQSDHLLEHRRRRHLLASQQKFFACKTCSRKFKSSADLTRHVNSVHEVRASTLHPCSQCPRSFDRKSSLLRHAKVHEPPDPADSATNYPHTAHGVTNYQVSFLSRVEEGSMDMESSRANFDEPGQLLLDDYRKNSTPGLIRDPGFSAIRDDEHSQLPGLPDGILSPPMMPTSPFASVESIYQSLQRLEQSCSAQDAPGVAAAPAVLANSTNDVMPAVANPANSDVVHGESSRTAIERNRQTDVLSTDHVTNGTNGLIGTNRPTSNHDLSGSADLGTGLNSLLASSPVLGGQSSDAIMSSSKKTKPRASSATKSCGKTPSGTVHQTRGTPRSTPQSSMDPPGPEPDLSAACQRAVPKSRSSANHLTSQLKTSMDAEGRRTCSFCGKGFKKPIDLERHLRIHTDEKPFLCTICRRRFRVASTLKNHMRTHRAERSALPCTECDGLFASKASLEMHMRIHRGTKPVNCPHCDEGFRNPTARSRHVKSVHTDEAPANPPVLTPGKTSKNGKASKILNNDDKLAPDLPGCADSQHSNVSGSFQPVLTNETMSVDANARLNASLTNDGLISIHLAAPNDTSEPQNTLVVSLSTLESLAVRGLSLVLPCSDNPGDGGSSNLSENSSVALSAAKLLSGLQEAGMVSRVVESRVLVHSSPGSQIELIPAPSITSVVHKDLPGTLVTNGLQTSTPMSHPTSGTAALSKTGSDPLPNKFEKSASSRTKKSDFITSCVICRQTFTNVVDSDAHFLSTAHAVSHTNAYESADPALLNMGEHRCCSCVKVHNRLSHLQRHLLTHKAPSYACVHCKKVFAQKSSLNSHVKRMHEQRESAHCIQHIIT